MNGDDRSAGVRQRLRRRFHGRRVVVCAVAAGALALTALVVPRTQGGGGSTGTAADPRPGTPAHAARAADDSCDPTASLNPSSGSDDGAAVQRIRKRGRLVVGVDQNSYLWGYRNPDTGQLEGFDIDLVKAIAKDILGDSGKVTYKTVPTAKRIPDLTTKDPDTRVDMVVRTMTINCQRLKQVAFSTVYFEAGQQLLVPKSSPVTGLNGTVRGRTVCAEKGSTGIDYVEDHKNGAHILRVDNQLDCLVRLQLGEADAVITDNTLAAGQAVQDPTTHLVGDVLTDEPYGVAMNLGDTDLVRRVNKVLADYRSGGSDSPWMKSFDKWLADVMPRPASPPRAHYRD